MTRKTRPLPCEGSEFGDRIPTGLLYLENKETFHEKNPILKDGKPLAGQIRDMRND